MTDSGRRHRHSPIESNTSHERAASFHTAHKGAEDRTTLTILTLLRFPEGMLMILVTVGLMDHWFDFRRLNRIATLQAGQNE